MSRRGGRDRWRPHRVPPPAQRPSFIVEPTRAVVDMRGPGPHAPSKHDEPVPPPEWLRPGVLVNYHPILHPRMSKGVPALRNVRVLSIPVNPGGRDWLVKIEGKRHPVPTWTLERVAEEPVSPASDLNAA